jgi:dihydroorotate dehydrogenase
VGTYTLDRRGGWLKKILRAFLTVRPIPGGWVNNIGLQNPGILSLKQFHTHKIYSIAALEINEWDELLKLIPTDTRIELNLSCPNTKHEIVIENEQILRYLHKFPDAIFKLSPTDTIMAQIDNLVGLGVRFIHIANTLPVPRGGESGERLKDFSLKAIKRARSKYPDLQIVGGGGIYSLEDVRLYRDAGANHFSLASIWFNPFKALRLLEKI